jgi:hypothetical protein
MQKLGVATVFFLAAVSVLVVSVVTYLNDNSEFQEASALTEVVKGLITQKLEEDEESRGSKHCDEACLSKRRRIAAQMKALQRQINDDYTSMISFGHKAGYVPPVKSIKQQVMDGSLLSSGDDEAAPPPFDPNLRSPSVFGEAREKKLLQSEEPKHSRKRIARSHDDHGSLSLPRVHSVDEMAHKYMHESDSSGLRHNHQKHHDEQILEPHFAREKKFHKAGHIPNAKWKKLFSFMQKGPHDEAPKVVKAPRTTIPSAVRRAIQRVNN